MDIQKKDGLSDNLAVVIAVVAVVIVSGFVGVFLLASSVEKENIYSNSLSGSESLSDEDYDFCEWVIDLSNEMSYDCNGINRACDDYNMYLLSYYGEKLEEDSEKYLLEIYDFDNLSPKVGKVKGEIKLALNDFKESGYYCQIGAESESSTAINMATSYMNQGTYHINQATTLIDYYWS